jgi:uncharacterized membrane protein YdjX (TVP38/TMEM64 family)
LNRPSSGRSVAIPSLLRRLSLPAVLILFGVILLLLGFRISDLSDRLRSTGNWAPILFITAGVISMSMLMPKTMVSLAAGALLGTAVGCPIMLVTAVAAATLNYSIGKYWIAAGNDPGTNSVENSQTACGVSSTVPSSVKWPMAIRQMARDAGFGVHLLVRLSPIPTTLISYSMGAAGARFMPYLAAAAAGVLPQFLYVHAASLATDADQSLRYRWISSILSLSVAAIVSIALPPIAAGKLKEIRATPTSD